MMDVPDTRYLMTDDGVGLAYSVVGEGPALVRASGFPSHIAAAGITGATAGGPQLDAASPAFVAYAAPEAVTVKQWDFMTVTIASRATGYGNADEVRACADFMNASITALLREVRWPE